MKAAIYARVSTEEQTTENQLPALRALAESRGWEVFKEYTEEVSAWRSGHQQELKAMLKDASYKRFNYLLVWSLDRLTREGIGTIMNYVHTLKNYDVQIISVQESWTEQMGPMADLLFAITGWIAEFESKRRSERVKAGMERRRAQGLPIGRQTGTKDKKPRRRTGYLLRYADRRRE